MPRKVKISDIRRDQLTHAAMKCIAVKGYDRVTLDDVTHEAGLSKGIVSYYFKNREELLVSVIRRMWDDTITLTKNIFDLPNDMEDEKTLYEKIEKRYANPKLDLIAQIQNGVKPLLTMLEKNRNWLKVILEFWTQIDRNPVISELNDSMWRYIMNISAIGIAEGIKQGVFKDRDPHVAAYTLISAIMGVAFSQVVNKNEFDREILDKAVSDLILDYLLA